MRKIAAACALIVSVQSMAMDLVEKNVKSVRFNESSIVENKNSSSSDTFMKAANDIGMLVTAGVIVYEAVQGLPGEGITYLAVDGLINALSSKFNPQKHPAINTMLIGANFVGSFTNSGIGIFSAATVSPKAFFYFVSKAVLNTTNTVYRLFALDEKNK